MKKILTGLIIIFMFPLAGLAQTGKIAGKVTSAATGKGLEGVAVFLEDSRTGTYTQTNGSYILKDIPTGNHTVHARFIGYQTQSSPVAVQDDETVLVNFTLEIDKIRIEGIGVNATRAIKRETPIAFTDIGQEVISDKYTTDDIPQLLVNVPGLFASSTGIGEAEITLRGFDADKIQVLINGIPVNDPESQKVYWSNWTGLSSNVKSVQVQRGAGSSLYGSGAFGGSLNIETIGSTPDREFSVRSSFGGYLTEGDVADGEGDISGYDPYNYNVVLRYNSGNLYRGKFNYNLMLERKAGDSYITGTNYDGYSFGVEAQSVFSHHTINLSFIGAPQEHNQVYFKSDRNLMKTLGREYNRNNHPYQENYYFKPQISLRDKWEISEEQLLMTNLFFTKGDGGGKYLNQDKFDINTGKLYYRDDFLDQNNPAAFENNLFGKHALYLYQTYGVLMEDFLPSDPNWFGYPSYRGNIVAGAGQDFFLSRYDYSWRNNQISDHLQMGMNTYYQNDISPKLKLVLGGELRRWQADHIGKRENFRHFSADFPDSVETYTSFQTTYDYTSSVLNLSTFARLQFKPLPQMNVMLDGQYARYSSRVEENPIELFDLGTGQPLDVFFYSTKNITVTDSTGQEVLKFSDDDYEKIYSFFSPKLGINYNLTEYLNILANYSIAYKEPRTTEWYSGYDGPDGKQTYTQYLVDENNQSYQVETFYGELKPERINTIEFGAGYEGVGFDVGANYYISDYVDKIEYVNVPVTNYYYDAEGDSIYTVERDVSLTLNAGEARHQGLELNAGFRLSNFDGKASLSLSTYRWTSMNVEEIFGGSAEEMKGKVVPYSPERMATGEIGYTLHQLPLDGSIRLGFSGKFWDGYYANYTNEYYSNYIDNGLGSFVADTTSVTSSELPYFLEFGANIKYAFKFKGKDCFVRLDLNNIFNRSENYSSANVRSDYNRGYFNEEGEFVDDYLTGNNYMYVSPAPLFNLFLTAEMKF